MWNIIKIILVNLLFLEWMLFNDDDGVWRGLIAHQVWVKGVENVVLTGGYLGEDNRGVLFQGLPRDQGKPVQF